MAHLLALLLRYYVHRTFFSSARKFLEAYIGFAPFFTAICLVIFFVFGLYDGMWRHAGINDMNRIILANCVTAAVNVLGTKLFYVDMPKSYYIVGGLLQFIMIAGIRFAGRAFQGMRERSAKMKSWSVPAMVVGTGDCAREFMRYLQDRTVFDVVTVVGRDSGSMMNGIPVVDYRSFPAWIETNDVKAVFLADEQMTEQEKAAIREAAGDVQVRDYIGYLTDTSAPIRLDALLSVSEGPVTIIRDGAERKFGSADECRAAMGDRLEVKRVRGASIEV